jgi:SNF2 family DNA or RNA helicase
MSGLRTQDTTWVHSAKTQALWVYLTEQVRIHETNTKVVLFSQWTSCLDLLGYMLRSEGVGVECYDGRVNTTEEREEVISRFRDSPDCKVLLTSLGAGGEGVNLTFATHVVLFEPYWNQAVEQQAVDRLHRIGQKETTHVVRFIVKDTIEEWVQSIQTKKSSELQRVLFGNESESDAKRPITCIRSQFDDANAAKNSAGLGAFIRLSKRIKV